MPNASSVTKKIRFKKRTASQGYPIKITGQFSRAIFWDTDPAALPCEKFIRRVVRFGTLADIRRLFKLVPRADIQKIYRDVWVLIRDFKPQPFQPL
jgi:hypothetical protein